MKKQNNLTAKKWNISFSEFKSTVPDEEGLSWSRDFSVIPKFKSFKLWQGWLGKVKGGDKMGKNTNNDKHGIGERS